MKILFVGMPDSIHVVRWINQIIDQGWDIHLFACYDAAPHPDLHSVTFHNLFSEKLPHANQMAERSGNWIGREKFRKLEALARRFKFLHPNRASQLARTIRSLKPDIIHSMEFQHAGYLVLEAKAILRDRLPPWIATNWGNDVYLFGRLAAHRDKVTRILEECDYYDCECERDVHLAKEYGLRGAVLLPVLPNTGGFDLTATTKFRKAGPVSSRRNILVKGYQHWQGRSLVALRAIELCEDYLRGYRVQVYSCGGDSVELKAQQISSSTNIPVMIVSRCSHEDMLRLHGAARVSMTINISDGVCTAFLEALVMGAFPIQSCTACANEWIEDGKTGFIVPPEDPEVVADAIRRAVSDDDLVDRAAEQNSAVTQERLDQRKVKAQVIKFYREIGAEVVGRKR